ncbi:HTH-type transcriptional regulator LutR [anaerobic digester metagenome]
MNAIKRRSLSEQVVDSVLNYIKENNLQPGDQLPTESEFAEIFQVSRTSIREAMKALSINGMFTSIAGKGTFLQPKALSMSIDDNGVLQMEARATITEIMEVRTPLEIQAIGLAAQRVTEEELTELEEITAHYRQAVSKGAGWPEWGSKFHAKLAAMSKNPLLITTLQQLSAMVERYRDNLATFYDDKTCYIQSHQNICEALRAHDVSAAREEMAAHMQMTERALQDIVDGENANRFLQ